MPLSEEYKAEIENAVQEHIEETAINEDNQEDVGTEEMEENQEQIEDVEDEQDVNADKESSESESTETDSDTDADAEVTENTSEVEVEQSGDTDTDTERIADSVIRRAINLGFSVEDIAAFQNERTLIAACVLAERSVPRKADESKEDDALDILSKINTDDFESETAKILQTLIGEIKSQRDEIATLKNVQSEISARSAASQAAEIENWFDTKITGLGKEYEPVLGKGKYQSLNQRSPQFGKREEIADKMAILLAGYAAAGKAAPSRDVVFDQAMRLVLSKETEKINTEKTKTLLDKRKGQHINRPSKSDKKTVTGDADDEIAALIDSKFFKK